VTAAAILGEIQEIKNTLRVHRESIGLQCFKGLEEVTSERIFLGVYWQ